MPGQDTQASSPQSAAPRSARRAPARPQCTRLQGREACSRRAGRTCAAHPPTPAAWPTGGWPAGPTSRPAGDAPGASAASPARRPAVAPGLVGARTPRAQAWRLRCVAPVPGQPIHFVWKLPTPIKALTKPPALTCGPGRRVKGQPGAQLNMGCKQHTWVTRCT